MAEARATLARLQALASHRYVTPYGVALVYDGLGDRAKALDWLERAFGDRSHWLISAWRSIRDSTTCALNRASRRSWRACGFRE